MYVGRLDADKFALDLVDCLASVRQRFADAQLACAGTGALAAEMQQRARALGVGDGLHLLGAVDLARVAGPDRQLPTSWSRRTWATP